MVWWCRGGWDFEISVRHTDLVTTSDAKMASLILVEAGKGSFLRPWLGRSAQTRLPSHRGPSAPARRPLLHPPIPYVLSPSGLSRSMGGTPEAYQVPKFFGKALVAMVQRRLGWKMRNHRRGSRGRSQHSASSHIAEAAGDVCRSVRIYGM